MATEIVDISGSNFINIENASISRELPIGTNWTKINNGMRYCWENIGTDNAQSGEGFLGLCARTTWPVGRTPPIHALGTSFDPGQGIEGDPWRMRMNEGYWVRKIGSSTTYAATLSRWWIQSIAYLPADNGTTTAAWVLQITKGSPWVIDLISRANTGETPTTDIPTETSLENFRLAMLMESATSIGTIINGSSRARNVTIDEETNGYFDSVCLYWPLETPSLFVSEISVVKFIG